MPSTSTQDSIPIAKFPWLKATVKLVEQHSQLMKGEGPLAAKRKSSATSKPWSREKPEHIGLFAGTPPPHSAVAIDDYRAANPEELPVEFAIAESGSMIPFDVKTGPTAETISLNRHVTHTSRNSQEL